MRYHEYTPSPPPSLTRLCFFHPAPSAPRPPRALVTHSYLQDATGAGLSALVDLAVAQGAVGTVLSTDGEDDAVFGFVTALPLGHLAEDNECAQAR